MFENNATENDINIKISDIKARFNFCESKLSRFNHVLIKICMYNINYVCISYNKNLERFKKYLRNYTYSL